MLAENGYTFYMYTHFTCIHHYNRRGNIWTCKHHWKKWDAGWYKLDERLKIFQQTCINGTTFGNIWAIYLTWTNLVNISIGVHYSKKSEII